MRGRSVVFPYFLIKPYHSPTRSLCAPSCAAVPPVRPQCLTPLKGLALRGQGGTRSLAPGLFGRARLYPGSCARECTAEGAVCPPSRERNDAPFLSCARRAHSRRGSSPPSCGSAMTFPLCAPSEMRAAQATVRWSMTPAPWYLLGSESGSFLSRLLSVEWRERGPSD